MGGADIYGVMPLSRTFWQRGFNSYNVFFFPLVGEGREYPNTTKSAPSSPSMAFRCLTDDGLILNGDLVAVRF